jgi:hypothetical protein
MKIKVVIGVFVLLLYGANYSYAQLFPSLAISGGPTAGWHFMKTDVLNSELQKAGFPQVSTGGFFTLGGGGFIDLPLKKNFIRVGGFGTGFSTNLSRQVNDTLTKALDFSYGMGGISIEFVKPFGSFDITIGAQFATGTLKLNLYQYGSSYGNWNSIFGETSSNSSSSNITRNFKVRFYSVQPQIGFGLLLKKFIYFKLNAGYLLSTNGTWKVDNDVNATSVPTGIKTDGFNINLGVNIGIFFRE